MKIIQNSVEANIQKLELRDSIYLKQCNNSKFCSKNFSSQKKGYGQTETTLIAGTFRGMEVKPGSMGKPAPGYNVAIVDDKGSLISLQNYLA